MPPLKTKHQVSEAIKETVRRILLKQTDLTFFFRSDWVFLYFNYKFLMY